MKTRQSLLLLGLLCVGQITISKSVSAETVQATSTVSFMEGQAAVTIDPVISVFSNEFMMEGADNGTVAITSGFQPGDVLSYTAPNCISNSNYNSSTGVLSLSGPAGCESPAFSYWTAAFRAVKFSSTADTPNTSRTIQFDTNTTDPESRTISMNAGAPNQPLAPVVVAGDQLAVITVTPATGGLSARSHIVTAIPGGRTCEISSASGTCTVTGLTNGVAYTFASQSIRLTASSIASPASLAVTPAAPVAVVQPPVESVPVTTEAPSSTITPPTSIVSTTTVPVIPVLSKLRIGRFISSRSLAKIASMKISQNSKIKLTVMGASKARCRVISSRITAIQTGTCRFKVVVTTRGKSVTRTATLRIVR